MSLILCEHITLYSKRDFADVIKRTDLKIKMYSEFKCRPDLITWALKSQEPSLARIRRFMKQSKVGEIPKWEELNFWSRPTCKNQRGFGDLQIAPSWKLTKKLRTSVLQSREGNDNPLQYSCLENPMDGGAAVHGVAKSPTRLSDFTFTFHFHALEKEMATHSSVLAWRIPGTGEPDGLPSMGLHRVGHDWSDLAAAAAAAAVLQSKHREYSANSLTRSFQWTAWRYKT